MLLLRGRDREMLYKAFYKANSVSKEASGLRPACF